VTRIHRRTSLMREARFHKHYIGALTHQAQGSTRRPIPTMISQHRVPFSQVKNPLLRQLSGGTTGECRWLVLTDLSTDRFDDAGRSCLTPEPTSLPFPQDFAQVGDALRP
jgi:hypothetical protein